MIRYDNIIVEEGLFVLFVCVMIGCAGFWNRVFVDGVEGGDLTYVPLPRAKQ